MSRKVNWRAGLAAAAGRGSLASVGGLEEGLFSEEGEAVAETFAVCNRVLTMSRGSTNAFVSEGSRTKQRAAADRV